MPGGGTIGRNDNLLVHAGAMGIKRDLRRALGLAGGIERLADDHAPAFEAGMLPGCDDTAFHSG